MLQSKYSAIKSKVPWNVLNYNDYAPISGISISFPIVGHQLMVFFRPLCLEKGLKGNPNVTVWLTTALICSMVIIG